MLVPKPAAVALTLGILGQAACVRAPRVATRGYWVSSDSSLYSPTAQLRIDTEVLGDVVRIQVYEGRLSVPGQLMPGAPPLMSRLYLTALLAVADSVVSSVDGRVASDRRAWRRVATSDSFLVASEIRYGETLGLKPMTLDVPARSMESGERHWIVFQIRGDAVEISPPSRPGGEPVRRDRSNAVLVYACGDRDVHGQVSSDRGVALRRAYGIAC